MRGVLISGDASPRPNLPFIAVLAAVLLASAGAPTARAHELTTETVRGHMTEDAVTHTPAQERRLERRSEAATAADARAAAQAVGDDPGVVGQWGPVEDWPVVAIHAALLPNGKVVAWDSMLDAADKPAGGTPFTRATVWDPATGVQTPATVTTGFNIFCAGLAHLADGRLFAAGGNQGAGDGIAQTHIFDFATNTWTRGPDMSEERWYPTVTPLDDGEMLISSGQVDVATQGLADVPEVRATDGSIRRLDAAPLAQPLYPWMDVAPDGRTFNSGPDTTMYSLDTSGAGAWQNHGDRDAVFRDYGGHALFDIGKILVAGGGPSTDTAVVIDVNTGAPQVSPTDPMETGRRQHNLTVLADGTVLATGGNSSGSYFVDLDNGVYNAELWDPSTGHWTTLAAMQETRQYHSTALLLPDGRVLSAGGGVCTYCDQVGYLEKNAEVFSPPYLFKHDGSGQLAQRPAITSAPAAVPYDTPFSVATQSGDAIGKVALVRLGAVTHSVNMEQRYIPLQFQPGSGKLVATSPQNANIAPPGVYMLFVIDSNGVPSVAKMVRVDPDAPAPPLIADPPNDFSIGKTKLNKRKGTATIKVTVPGAGELTLAGSRLRTRGPADSVDAAGTFRLKVVPKGKAKRRLKKTGRARVSPEITFTPTGGQPATQQTTLKLKRKRAEPKR